VIAEKYFGFQNFLNQEEANRINIFVFNFINWVLMTVIIFVLTRSL